MMNNQVITPLTISDLNHDCDTSDLKFFMRLGVISPSAFKNATRPRSHSHINRDKLLGAGTMIAVSAAAWTAIAYSIVYFLK